MTPFTLAFVLFTTTADAAACWSLWGCVEGSSDWQWQESERWWLSGWWERHCICEENWAGDCCDEIETCTTEMSDLCPQSAMTEATETCEAVDASGPISIGKAPLPEQLRGVFWLSEQGDSSALVSFAKSNDGQGLSPGSLTTNGDYEYKIRVGGDRVWSFHDKASSWGLVEVLDLVYKFDFDDAANPTQAQIIPSGENLNGFDLTATWLLDFRMELAPEGSHTRYPNSVIWGRPSAILGFEGGYYDLIQVMDEDGNKLQPAFDDWVEYCKGPETGSTPGELHFRYANP